MKKIKLFFINWILPPSIRIFFRKILTQCRVLMKYRSLRKNNDLKNIRNSDEVYIIGNGPSMASFDFNLLEFKDVLVCNQFYALEGSRKIRPIVYSIGDPVEQNKINEYKDFLPDLKKVASIDAKAYLLHSSVYDLIMQSKIDFKCRDKIYHYCGGYDDKIALDDMCSVVSPVRFTSMLNFILAVFMGYKKIYLLGMDQNHYYNFFCFGKVFVEHGYDSNPFAGSINPEIVNYDWISASLGAFRTYSAWKMLFDLANKRNIEVYDLTTGGKLDIFPKKNINEFL